MFELDELDKEILKVLQGDARMPLAEVARKVDVARATVHQRVKRLEQAGVIRGATLELDPGALGRPLRAFILIGWRAEASTDQRAVAREIAAIDGVVRVHNVTGQKDFLVEVLGKDMDEVGRLIIERIRPLPGVGGTETLMAFWTFEGAGVPLEAPPRPDGA